MHTSKGSEKDGVKKLTKHLLITDHQNNARECLDIRNFIFAVTKTKLNIPSGCDTNAIVCLKQIIAGLRQESGWQQDILLGGRRVCFLGGVMISGRLASGDQKLTLEVVPLPPSSGGDLPCISHVYTHPRPQGWHLRRFGLKRCIDFTHERIYRFNSKWIRKKTGEMLEFEWILRNLFSWRSNLSNDDIIS